MLQAPTKPISFSQIKSTFGNFSFILPAVIIFSLFYLYPFYDIFNLSLHQWDGISSQRFPVGSGNFKELMSDKIWWSSIGHAGFITFLALTFQNALAFALALACDRQIKLKTFYCVVFFIPPILSEIVVGLVWRWILHSGLQDGQHIGLLNYGLEQLGFAHLAHHWLSDPKTALTTIAVVHCWKGFGWGFVMFLAGLQTIDRQLYEAARVDGANAWSVLKNVTIPMMAPVILLVVILTILGSMQVFVLVLSMVGQGLAYHTEVPATRILAAMVGTNRFGYASAMGVEFGIMLVAVSFILKRLSDKVKQM